MIERRDAATITEFMFNNSFNEEYHRLSPWAFIGRSGLCAIISENNAILGYGVSCRLTPTSQLLAAISDWNRTMRVGNYWLAEGGNNQNWSLVCGFKYYLDWEVMDTFAAKIGNVCGAYDTLLDRSKELASQFGGESYWETMTSDGINARGAGLILVGHIG